MKHIRSHFACKATTGLVLSMLSLGFLNAASVTFSGTESGSPVLNWSDTDTPKSQDLNGDDRFGGAGYYQIVPGATGDTWSQDAPDNNNLGLSVEYPTLASIPSFIDTGLVGKEGTYLNFSLSPDFRNPSDSSWLRQGALWLIADNQTSGTVPGGASGTRIIAFTFTLSASASFRLGVVVDTLGESYNIFSPDRISVFNTNTGEVFSTQLNRDGIPDMAFFNIGGSAGDVFEVAFWQTDTNISTGERVAFSLVTFDRAPIPTLTCTQNVGSVTLSWEQNIPGWTLESSTDLGVGDSWDPVPDVINNSVTLPTTGVPKNFFRLKMSP